VEVRNYSCQRILHEQLVAALLLLTILLQNCSLKSNPQVHKTGKGRESQTFRKMLRLEDVKGGTQLIISTNGFWPRYAPCAARTRFLGSSTRKLVLSIPGKELQEKMLSTGYELGSPSNRASILPQYHRCHVSGS
jgi:hypothetical protein